MPMHARACVRLFSLTRTQKATVTGRVLFLSVLMRQYGLLVVHVTQFMRAHVCMRYYVFMLLSTHDFIFMFSICYSGSRGNIELTQG